MNGCNIHRGKILISSQSLVKKKSLVKTDTIKCTEAFLLISVHLLSSCSLMDPPMHWSLEKPIIWASPFEGCCAKSFRKEHSRFQVCEVSLCCSHPGHPRLGFLGRIKDLCMGWYTWVLVLLLILANLSPWANGLINLFYLMFKVKMIKEDNTIALIYLTPRNMEAKCNNEVKTFCLLWEHLKDTHIYIFGLLKWCRW